MRATKLGHLLFGVSLAVVGVLSLISGDFAFVWQPVPAWVPWRPALAYASGVMLLAGGLGMLIPRTARRATLLLTVNMVIWLILLRIPPALAQPSNEGNWLGVGETTMLVTGGWILLVMLGSGVSSTSDRYSHQEKTLRLPRLLYGIALPLVGLSHFIYLKAVEGMIPGWIPFHEGFAYLTGAGHIAAGLGILFGVLPRLAATMEASMVAVFTALVCVPNILGAPGSRLQWTALFISAAMTGAAWAVAGSFQDLAWLGVGNRQRLVESPRPA